MRGDLPDMTNETYASFTDVVVSLDVCLMSHALHRDGRLSKCSSCDSDISGSPSRSRLRASVLDMVAIRDFRHLGPAIDARSSRISDPSFWCNVTAGLAGHYHNFGLRLEEACTESSGNLDLRRSACADLRKRARMMQTLSKV